MKTNYECPGVGHAVYGIGGRRQTVFKRYNENCRRLQGFTFVELMIVVSVIGLLAAIAVPKAMQARDTARVRSCVANLTQLDRSKQLWAAEFRKGESSVPLPDDIAPYLRANELPECPASGVYNLRRVEHSPVCSLYTRGHTVNPANPEEDSLP